jgi:hypothetical protein
MQLPLELLLLLLLVQMLHRRLGADPWWSSCSCSWVPW